MKYHYFVSYSHNGTNQVERPIFSNEEIVLDSRIESIKDIRKIESEIYNSTNYSHITVINYIFIRISLDKK